MKNHSYSNRGMTFETYLGYINQRYKATGEAVIVKIPTAFIPLRSEYGKVVDVKVEEKSVTDYIGRFRDIPIAMEAKHTNGEAIRFDVVKDHQAAFLDAYTGTGDAIGLILVSFAMKDFYAVPWPFWDAARRAWETDRGNKHTICFLGQGWTTPGKASVRQEELLQDWKVPENNRFGLDYLHGIRELTERDKIKAGGATE